MKNKISHSDRVIIFVLEYDTDDYENLTVERLSKSLNISRSQLWRVFKNERKMTIEEYIIKIKLYHAAKLLAEDYNSSIKEIAKKVGYYSYDYFIRIFKKHFGTTPARFREIKGKKK